MTRYQHLKNLWKHMDYYNKMSPFPIYDSEYVEDVKKEVEKTEDIDYDEEPVVACKYCKSLHITTHIQDNETYDVCNRCYTANELIEFPNIHEYNEYLLKHGHPVYYGKDTK